MAAVSVAGQAPSSDENAKFLERWRAEIKGREQDPGGQVFKNHERNFASEDKPPKRAARESRSLSHGIVQKAMSEAG